MFVSVIDRMMAESPEAYVGDDLTSASNIVLVAATSINLLHDQEQLEPYIEHILLHFTDLEPEHTAVMLILTRTFSARCTIVQSAVLWLHVVRLSVRL